MKKNSTLFLVVALLALSGCKDKAKIEAPQIAGMDVQNIPAGSGKKGTVIQTMNAGGYTYVEAADEAGVKTWLALPEMKVAVDDKIQYAETAPMVDYHSKTLNKKFDKILFVPGIKIEK